jgi:O-antigen ligase
MNFSVRNSLLVVLAAALLMAALVLAGFPVKYYAGLLVVILFGYLLFLKPLYFLALLFFVRAACDIFFESIRFPIGGIDIGLGGLFSVFLMGTTLLYAVSQNDRLHRLKHGTVILYALFCALSLLSAYLSPQRVGALRELVSRYSIFSIMLITLLVVRNSKEASFLLKCVIASAFFPVVIGYARLILGITQRFEGTFSHANIMAFFLLIVIGAMIFQLYRREGTKPMPVVALPYLVFLLSAFIFTQTRSAWAALLFMIGLYVLFFRRKWIVPLLACVALAAATPVVTTRIAELFVWKSGGLALRSGTSLDWRLEAWQYLWDYAIQKPFWGHGINASHLVGRRDIDAHNDYLRFFLEAGIPGVLLYFGVYVYTLQCAWKSLRRGTAGDPGERKLAVFLQCYIPAFLLMSVSENLANYTTVNFYIMAIIALYIVLSEESRRQRV